MRARWVDRVLGVTGYELRPVARERMRWSLSATEDGVAPLFYRLQGFAGRRIVAELPIEHCINAFGFGFGPGGWHPFVSTLQVYQAGVASEVKESPLLQYYESFQPCSVAEALGIPNPTPALTQLPPLAWVCPWNNTHPDTEVQRRLRITRAETAEFGEGVSVDGAGFKHFGPCSGEFAEVEWLRLTSVHDSIRRYGYQEERADGDIVVQVLRAYGVERYLVVGGHHRVAALAALGYRAVPARLWTDPVPVIHAEDAAAWPQVRAGLFSVENAQAYAGNLFSGNGRGRARALGLLASSSA